MPVFNYKVRDKFGILIKGRIEDYSRESLADHLQNSGYTVVSIAEQSEFEKQVDQILQNLSWIKQQEVVIFTRQLSSMLKAGLPLLLSLENLAKQVPNKKLSEIIISVKKDVEAGGSFSDSLAKHPKIFPEFFISMVNVGEVSGKLDEVLERLASYGLQKIEIRSKIRAAMMYPMFLFSIMIIVVIIMLTYVLPKFVEIFEKTGKELPLLTRMLLNVSFFVRHYWWAALLIIGVLIYLGKKFMSDDKGKFKIHKFSLAIPYFGNLVLNYNIATMTRTLGNLLKSGISLVQALNVTENTTQNVVLKYILNDLRENVIKGKGISEQLKMSGFFPPMVIQMISAGEQTGRIEEMLGEIADFYDIEVDYAIRNLTAIVEPLMLLVMGILVGAIALAILTPIFGLVKLFKKKHA